MRIMWMTMGGQGYFDRGTDDLVKLANSRIILV